ncbi:MAG TPA: hypothetical protein VNU28_01980 [Solirubrobacteraceae bacterium]|jgi:hypothetical protein|nr:hypothetical protein [Solirubrobacteraceae bacterium]
MRSTRTTGDRKPCATARTCSALIALLGLCMMLGAGGTTSLASAAAAARARSSCSTSDAAQSGCAAVLAHASDSEAEEPEEELQEDVEEQATTEAEAEAEAEEAEGGEMTLPATGSDNSTAVSDLKLTARAAAALAHRLPPVSAIGFSFTLSSPASVRITIVKQTSTSGHGHWTRLPDSLTLSVAQGRATRSLKGENRLSPGRYRLTVKPAGGRPRSIYLSAHR